MSNFIKVERALTIVRSYLQRGGGDIELISVENCVAKVKFLGFCSTCDKSRVTLSSIAAIIREQVPEIIDVIE